MSVSCQISDPDLIEKFLFLKIGQTAFICQVTRLINKIDSCIRDSKRPKKVVCLSDQLAVILEKLNGMNDQCISLAENPD